MNGEIYAIKIFKIDTTDENLMNQKIRTIGDEFDMFKTINHKNLVNYLYRRRWQGRRKINYELYQRRISQQSY